MILVILLAIGFKFVTSIFTSVDLIDWCASAMATRYATFVRSDTIAYSVDHWTGKRIKQFAAGYPRYRPRPAGIAARPTVLKT